MSSTSYTIHYAIEYADGQNPGTIAIAEVYHGSASFDTVKFIYVPGIIVKTKKLSNDTFFMNASGQIYRAKVAGYDINYTYRGNEIVYNGADNFFNGYKWENGNIAKMYSDINKEDTGLNKYYDTPFAAGDYFQLKEFLSYGRSITRSKNLLKSIYYVRQGITDNIIYTFDDKSRVTSCTVRSSDNNFYERFTIKYES